MAAYKPYQLEAIKSAESSSPSPRALGSRGNSTGISQSEFSQTLPPCITSELEVDPLTVVEPYFPKRVPILEKYLRAQQKIAAMHGKIGDAIVQPLLESELAVTKNPKVAFFLSALEQIRSLHESSSLELASRIEPFLKKQIPETVVGDITLKYAKMFKCFRHYAQFFEGAKATLFGCEDPDFLEFKKRVDQEMLAFLKKPDQRASDYLGLFDALLVVTPPDHEDYELIQQAYQELETVKDQMQEAEEYQKNLEQILEIQEHFETPPALGTIDGSRIFLRDGNFFKQQQLSIISAKKPLVLHLFTDILLVSETTTAKKLRLQRRFDLKQINVSIDLHKKNGLIITAGRKDHSYLAESAEIVISWYQDIKKQMKKLRGTNRLSRSVGRKSLSRTPSSSSTALGYGFSRMQLAKLVHDAAKPSKVAKVSSVSNLTGNSTTVDQVAWEDNSSRNGCWVCKTSFTIFNRKHHCRVCGRLVCNACSKGRKNMKSNQSKTSASTSTIMSLENMITEREKEVDATKSTKSKDERVCDFCVVQQDQAEEEAKMSALIASQESLALSDSLFANGKDLDPRLAVVNELLQTERTYVSKLRILNQVYVKPLVDTALSRVGYTSETKIDDDALHVHVPVGKMNAELAMFLGQVETVTSLNEEFLGDLESRVADWNDQIGDVLCDWASLFKMYGDYCRGHQKAVNSLKDKDMIAYLKSRQDDPRSEETFQSLLILPVQRIPRYELLLKELVKRTPADHPDAASVARALREVTASASHVNEAIGK